MTRIDEAFSQLANQQDSITTIQANQEAQNAKMTDLETALQSLTRSITELTQRFDNHTPPSSPNQTSTTVIPPTPSRQPPLLSSPNKEKNPTVALTTFDGNNPHNWIFQAERYFNYYSTPEDQRVELASFHMQGQALTWFQWMHRNKQIPSWPALAKALEQRFGPPTFLNPQATLFKLKQLTTIDHYQATFETLCNRITTLTPDSILQCFISGLKPHIQMSCCSSNPTPYPML